MTSPFHLRTDRASREILAGLRGLTREQIWATTDLTEIVAGVDAERYGEDALYAETVMSFVFERVRR